MYGFDTQTPGQADESQKMLLTSPSGS